MPDCSVALNGLVRDDGKRIRVGRLLDFIEDGDWVEVSRRHLKLIGRAISIENNVSGTIVDQSPEHAASDLTWSKPRQWYKSLCSGAKRGIEP